MVSRTNEPFSYAVGPWRPMVFYDYTERYRKRERERGGGGGEGEGTDRQREAERQRQRQTEKGCMFCTANSPIFILRPCL